MLNLITSRQKKTINCTDQRLTDRQVDNANTALSGSKLSQQIRQITKATKTNAHDRIKKRIRAIVSELMSRKYQSATSGSDKTLGTGKRWERP